MSNAKKKRSKAYYGVRPPKRRRLGHPEADLSQGMKGIIITTNVPEKRCVVEAYRLLNEYGEKLYGPEDSTHGSSDSGEEEEDIEEAIAKEMEGLKKSKHERRFQAVNTGVKNVVFIQCRDPVEPCQLLYNLFKEVVEEGKQKSRYCQRMIPVTAVCRATEQDIIKHAPTVLGSHFHVDDLQTIKFAVNYKTRNNNSVSRDAIIDLIASLVTKSKAYPHVVDLKNPDLVVNVDIIKNLCCLSVVKDFMKFRKYNLHAVMEPDENSVSVETKLKETTETATREEILSEKDEEKALLVTNSSQGGEVTIAVEKLDKNGGGGDKENSVASGETTQADEQVQQESCSERCEPQQGPSCGNTEP